MHTGGMGRYDELEPGQDDLVKEDKTSANLKRALKKSKADRPKDEALYTDRGGESFRARRARKKDPVKGSKLSSLKQMWAEALSDAERRQQERRAKKGK